MAEIDDAYINEYQGSRSRMKKAAVTGGAGFIGSHLAQELIRRGYRPLIVDLSTGKLETPSVDRQRESGFRLRHLTMARSRPAKRYAERGRDWPSHDKQ